MKIVKGSILQGARRLRPAQFIVKLNDAKKIGLKESELIEKGDRENDGIDKNDHKRKLEDSRLDGNRRKNSKKGKRIYP